MIKSNENSATVEDFLAYRHYSTEPLHSLCSHSDYKIDDAFLETVEMMENSKEFFLQRRTLMLNE